MRADDGSPGDAAQRLAAAAGEFRDRLAVQHGLLAEAALTCRPAAGVLADAAAAWVSADRPLPGGATVEELPGAPPVGAPVRRFRVRRGRSSAEVYLVAGDLADDPAVTVLMMRPGEAVAVISRRADPAQIAAGVAHLAAVVTGTLRLGGGAFLCYLERSPRLRGRVAKHGYAGLAHALDASGASFWTLPGPALGPAVAAEWSAFHPAAGDPGGVRATRTELGVRVRASWAWAAVERLVDTVDQAAWDLADVLPVADAVHQRRADLPRTVGDTTEAVVDPLRRALSDSRAVLSDMPGRPLWRRFGIRRVTPIELDTLVVHLSRTRFTSGPASLTVELVPTWFPGGDPPARGTEVDDRLVLEVNVAAEEERVRHEFWSRLAGGLALRYSVRGRSTIQGVPAGEFVASRDGEPRYIEKRARRHTAADLLAEPSAEFLAHTARRMVALAGRYEQVEAFAAWLGERRREAGLAPGVRPPRRSGPLSW